MSVSPISVSPIPATTYPKRAEVEADIRKIRRWCRGPKVLKKETIDLHRAEFDKAKTLPDMIALKNKLEDLHKLPHQDVTTLEEATGRIGGLIYAYPDTVGKGACGQDVNELILAGKLDGEEKTVKCPRCGEMLEFTPPQCEEDAR